MKEQIQITFKDGKKWADTKTASGKEATVYMNNTNIYRVYYQLVVDGKTIFSRGSMAAVLKKLAEL